MIAFMIRYDLLLFILLGFMTVDCVCVCLLMHCLFLVVDIVPCFMFMMFMLFGVVLLFHAVLCLCVVLFVSSV